MKDVIDSAVGASDQHARSNQVFIAESLDRIKSWIAPLNLRGKRTPMFFVFPISLDGACYVRLSEALGEDQPFYAFQVPSKERKPELATSIADIASRLIGEFEKAYPKGDFILGGWSAGVIIALEMAQQLTRKDRPPVLLIAIDHAPLNAGVGINPFYPSLLNAAIRIRALWRTSRDEKWNGFIPSPSVAIAKLISSRIIMLRSHVQKNSRFWKAPIRPHPIQHVLDGVRSPEMQELVKKLFQLLIKYKPSKYDGLVLLFLSSELPDLEYERKWSAFASNLKPCHFLGTPEQPTTHESFISGEWLDSFAKTLKERVDVVLQSLPGLMPTVRRV